MRARNKSERMSVASIARVLISSNDKKLAFMFLVVSTPTNETADKTTMAAPKTKKNLCRILFILFSITLTPIVADRKFYKLALKSTNQSQTQIRI